MVKCTLFFTELGFFFPFKKLETNSAGHNYKLKKLLEITMIPSSTSGNRVIMYFGVHSLYI